MVCRHSEDAVVFPNGTRVLASAWQQRGAEDTPPDFGLYLDPAWTPWWPSAMLDWPDFGVPADSVEADAHISDAFERARAPANASKSAASAATGAPARCWRAWPSWPASNLWRR